MYNSYYEEQIIRIKNRIGLRELDRANKAFEPYKEGFKTIKGELDYYKLFIFWNAFFAHRNRTLIYIFCGGIILLFIPCFYLFKNFDINFFTLKALLIVVTYLLLIIAVPAFSIFFLSHNISRRTISSYFPDLMKRVDEKEKDARIESIRRKTEKCKNEIRNETEKCKKEIRKETVESKNVLENEIGLSKNEIIKRTEESKKAISEKTSESKNVIEKETQESKNALINSTKKNKNVISEVTVESKNVLVNETEKGKNVIINITEGSKNAISEKTDESKKTIEKEIEKGRNAINKKTEKSKNEITEKTKESKIAIENETEKSKNVISKKKSKSNFLENVSKKINGFFWGKK